METILLIIKVLLLVALLLATAFFGVCGLIVWPFIGSPIWLFVGIAVVTGFAAAAVLRWMPPRD